MLSDQIVKIAEEIKNSDLEDFLWEAYEATVGLKIAINNSIKLNKDKKIQKILKNNLELLK